MANDLVWLTATDATLPLQEYPFIPRTNANGTFILGGDRFLQDKVGQYSTFFVNMCANNATAPYNFYFNWIAGRDIPAGLTSSTTTAFFGMDRVSDTQTGDNEPVVTWCSTKVGAPSNMALGVPSFYSTISDGIATDIRSWYGKPDTIIDRNHFIHLVNNFTCTFCATPSMSYSYMSSAGQTSAVPGRMPVNVYNGNEEVYPMVYAHGSTELVNVKDYQGHWGLDLSGLPVWIITRPDNSVMPAMRLPPTYKGTSDFFTLTGVTRDQFDTLNVGTNNVRNYICVGDYAVVAIPWNGSLPQTI
jgi:hypothetical protein